MNYSIRPISTTEYPLLETFLYEAIFVPEGVAPPPKSILEEPEIRMYISDFGEKEDDHCLVAVVADKIVGAVWARIIPDYGHVDDLTPSLSLSVLKNYRNRGIGTALTERILALLKDKGYPQASLSVQKDNPATKIFGRVGFEVLRENTEDYVMVCRL